MLKATAAKYPMSGVRSLLALGVIAVAMALTSCRHAPNKAADGTLYCVIDLSPGPSASRYPVSYLPKAPSFGWPDEYKTSKLVLRKIMPGSFRMGLYNSASGWSYKVTLTKPFYCGVFEVTQKQYELVMGTNPSYFKGEMKPVDSVSWDMVRGKSSIFNWPTSNAIDPDSFMGRLSLRTGLRFDLPTEAQWEFACCAGTATVFYWGNRMDGRYCWYAGNSHESTHDVGLKRPNGWGLYDMSGNLLEWCLDHFAEVDRRQLASETIDPVGPVEGEGGEFHKRAFRGGFWDTHKPQGFSSERYWNHPSFGFKQDGFRAVITLEPQP